MSCHCVTTTTQLPSSGQQSTDRVSASKVSAGGGEMGPRTPGQGHYSYRPINKKKCLSVARGVAAWLPIPQYTDCHEIWFWRSFRNHSRNFKIDQNLTTKEEQCTWRPIYLCVYICVCECIYDVSLKSPYDVPFLHINFRENQNTRFVLSHFFLESFRLWGNVEMYCSSRQDTDGNMAHAHCMLDT